MSTATLDLDSALSSVLDQAEGISDVNLTPGKQPQAEVHGELCAIRFGDLEGALTPADTEAIARALMGGMAHLEQDLEQTGSCDCGFQLSRGTRFRVNIFKSRGHHAIVLRALPSVIPCLDDMGLPPILEEIPKLKNGLVLVTGSTGSGKSTTIAAIIDRINSSRAVHVVTLEDPIEFSHPHKRATMNQREQGRDFGEFADGLRAALRQAPKVIVMGEMRDRETVEIGLKASETGHLVLSTLHTVDAGQTINRVAGMFEQAERPLVRARLAQVLRYTVCQRLLPRNGGGRAAALEIMGTNLRVRELIQNGETSDNTMYQAIADSKPLGWQTFDQHIVELYERGLVTAEAAMAYCSDRSWVGISIDRIKAAQGEETSELGELTMEGRHLQKKTR